MSFLHQKVCFISHSPYFVYQSLSTIIMIRFYDYVAQKDVLLSNLLKSREENWLIHNSALLTSHNIKGLNQLPTSSWITVLLSSAVN